MANVPDHPSDTSSYSTFWEHICDPFHPTSFVFHPGRLEQAQLSPRGSGNLRADSGLRVAYTSVLNRAQISVHRRTGHNRTELYWYRLSVILTGQVELIVAGYSESGRRIWNRANEQNGLHMGHKPPRTAPPPALSQQDGNYFLLPQIQLHPPYPSTVLWLPSPLLLGSGS